MARKLKTYITSIGFYDLAVAAPSMKAALEAWGARQNLFHQGLAQETTNPEIVSAAMDRPGVVLRRAVGSEDPFKEHARPPRSLPSDGAPPPSAPTRTRKSNPVRPPTRPPSPNAEKAAILSFEKERARRELARQAEEAIQAKEEAAEARREDRRAKLVQKAEAIRDRARERHEARMEKLEADRDEAEAALDAERLRWKAEERTLDRKVRDAGVAD